MNCQMCNECFGHTDARHSGEMRRNVDTKTHTHTRIYIYIYIYIFERS